MKTLNLIRSYSFAYYPSIFVKKGTNDHVVYSFLPKDKKIHINIYIISPSTSSYLLQIITNYVECK
jgi:hypothetical protein